MFVEISKKIENLKTILRKYKSIVIAFSGGMDSSLLVFIAREADVKIMAVIIDSPFSIKREIRAAAGFALAANIPHKILNINPLESVEVRDNSAERCYYCKKRMFAVILDFAEKNNYDFTADGSNLSDDNDFRPGRKALLEMGVISPLQEAGFDKIMIREACNFYGLNVPEDSNACLASRIPYGKIITEKKLNAISECEDFLLDMGFSPVRVRYYDSIARIELSISDTKKLISNEEKRQRVAEKFKKRGFIYITLDIEGFRSGSMN